MFLDLWRWRLYFNCKPLWLNTDDKETEEYAIARQRKRLDEWLAGLSSAARTTMLPGVAEVSAGAPARSGAWSNGSKPLMTRAALLKL